jgi:aminopeptidase
MSDYRRKKLADILTNYCVNVQPGDWVMIMAEGLVAVSLVNDVIEKVLEAGGHPTAMLESNTIQETKLKSSNEEQLSWVSPLIKLVANEADVLINITASSNTRALTNISPTKLRTRKLAMQEIMGIFMQRFSTGDIRWVGTQYPCQAFAQEADMSLKDYEDFVYAATYADQEDPVKEWTMIHDEQQKLVDWLKGKKDIVVKSPFADLTLSVENRTFINEDAKSNLPGGEIFTSPVEDSVNGWIEFSYPAIKAGREVDGIRLEFKDGKVINANAKKNEDFLLEMLETDEGAKYLGEFAIGTNYGIKKFSKSILFDEKIGGTIHLALGRGFAETGSENDSSIHWDMISDMREDSEILVDGELFYKDGQFMV